MRWESRGDSYVLIQQQTAPYTTYNGSPLILDYDVMRINAAIDEKGRRIGWYVHEVKQLPNSSNYFLGQDWFPIHTEPFARLDEAKTVAEAWWRMR